MKVCCSVSIEILRFPYWDWTSTVGLPRLATEYEEWRRGPIKGLENNQSFRDPENCPFFCIGFNENLREQQTISVQNALCRTNFGEFENQLNGPHGQIHIELSGSMATVAFAAYDPIFYLHHLYVDFLWAYWQELQRERGLSDLVTSQDFVNRQLPPFSGRVDNGDSVSIDRSKPNPFSNTRGIFSTSYRTINYRDSFGYSYDNFIFNGSTPLQFSQELEQRCTGRARVRVTLRSRLISSVTEIFVDGIGSFANVSVFGARASEVSFDKRDVEDDKFFILDVDVTNMFEKYKISIKNMSINYKARSYDLDGNRLESLAFKPMAGYVDEYNVNHYGVMDKYLDKYSPVNKFCNLDTQIMALHENGTELAMDVVTTFKYGDDKNPKKRLLIGPDTKCLLKESS